MGWDGGTFDVRILMTEESTSSKKQKDIVRETTIGG